MAANMWKNSLKNVESDNNKILYETLLDFFLQRNDTYFLNKPRNLEKDKFNHVDAMHVVILRYFNNQVDKSYNIRRPDISCIMRIPYMSNSLYMANPFALLPFTFGRITFPIHTTNSNPAVL